MCLHLELLILLPLCLYVSTVVLWVCTIPHLTKCKTIFSKILVFTKFWFNNKCRRKHANYYSWVSPTGTKTTLRKCKTIYCVLMHDLCGCTSHDSCVEVTGQLRGSWFSLPTFAWVPGIELRSRGSILRAFTHWTILPASSNVKKKKMYITEVRRGETFPYPSTWAESVGRPEVQGHSLCNEF